MTGATLVFVVFGGLLVASVLARLLADRRARQHLEIQCPSGESRAAERRARTLIRVREWRSRPRGTHRPPRTGSHNKVTPAAFEAPGGLTGGVNSDDAES